VSLLPSVRATSAPRGQTPVLRHHFAWKRLSIAGVLIDERSDLPRTHIAASASTRWSSDRRHSHEVALKQLQRIQGREEP
jgi:hypothetical protein